MYKNFAIAGNSSSGSLDNDGPASGSIADGKQMSVLTHFKFNFGSHMETNPHMNCLKEASSFLKIQEFSTLNYKINILPHYTRYPTTNVL